MTQYWPFSALLRRGDLRDRLVVSLDLGGPREALKLVESLARTVGMFKVGKTLYRNGGPDLVREIRKAGGEVFLDLKFHDRAALVVRAAAEATRLGVTMFDLHPSGGPELAERTRAEVARVCRVEGLRRPHILAVTMLTALGRGTDGDGLQNEGDRVAQLALRAESLALDGVFTSPQEAPRIRAACSRRFIIVTSAPAPVGRWNEWPAPASGAIEALRSGADYVVIGSPIWRSSEPQRALRALIDEMERGLRMNGRMGSDRLSNRSA